MKHLIILMFAVLTGLCMAVAQEAAPVRAKSVMTERNLEITWHKTTVLLFPAPIQSADRGDKTILAERVQGVENALKVKAGVRSFEPSNLHVITTDGKVYAFTVSYREHPANFTIDMGTKPGHSPAAFSGVSLNSRELELSAATIKGTAPFITGVRHQKFGMELRLEGIFIQDDVLFMQYRLKNHTHIRHDASVPRFYVRDKKRTKRTAVQDTEIEPVFIHHSGTPESVTGQSIIVAFPKFTIAESKYFVTELMEQGGDRNMHCRISQKTLLKARALH